MYSFASYVFRWNHQCQEESGRMVAGHVPVIFLGCGCGGGKADCLSEGARVDPSPLRSDRSSPFLLFLILPSLLHLLRSTVSTPLSLLGATSLSNQKVAAAAFPVPSEHDELRTDQFPYFGARRLLRIGCQCLPRAVVES